MIPPAAIPYPPLSLLPDLHLYSAFRLPAPCILNKGLQRSSVETTNCFRLHQALERGYVANDTPVMAQWAEAQSVLTPFFVGCALGNEKLMFMRIINRLFKESGLDTVLGNNGEYWSFVSSSSIPEKYKRQHRDTFNKLFVSIHPVSSASISSPTHRSFFCDSLSLSLPTSQS